MEGSGDTYVVMVNTGSGNGTIRLDVVDNDSILGVLSDPLGGAGLENGNFATGQTYTVRKIPIPQSPQGILWDRTPTHKWLKVPQATQYRYQLVKGTTTIYTKTVPACVCNSTACSHTPLTLLNPGVYQWRVQAMAGGAWQGYSPDLSFTLQLPKQAFGKVMAWSFL